MKTEVNSKLQYMRFDDLDIGATFIDPEIYDLDTGDPDILVRLDYNSKLINSNKTYVALDLTTNEIYEYSPDDTVFPVKVKVVADDI